MKQTRRGQSCGGQSSGGMSSGGMSSGGMFSGGVSCGSHYCRATCPSSTVAIQPPPFMLTIPGPSLYCPTQPCHIQTYGPSIGGGSGGGSGGGLGQIIGGGGGGQGMGGICGGGRGGGRKYSSFFFEPEMEWEPEDAYGSGLASLYYSRMGLPYNYSHF